MINALLSLPRPFGAIAFMALSTAIGLAVSLLTHRLVVRRQTEETMKEIGEVTGNLFRVVGWLFTLLLSLTFADVIGELAVTENAIEGEVSAILDIHHNLERFGPEATRAIQAHVVDYAQSVIDDDWPALAGDRLSERTDALLQRLEEAVLDLETTSPAQETLRTRIITDVDRIADFRLSRLQQSREQPSLVLTVVFFGYLATMVYFGVYRPQPFLVSLVAIYTVFVGVVIYLILALGDPFQGATASDVAPLEFALETMRAGRPSP